MLTNNSTNTFTDNLLQNILNKSTVNYQVHQSTMQMQCLLIISAQLTQYNLQRDVEKVLPLKDRVIGT